MSNKIFAISENLKNKETYEIAIKKVGYELIFWDDAPLKTPHFTNPIRVKIKHKKSAKIKDFIILRPGNTATLAIVKFIDGEPNILVKNEVKGTAVDLCTMASGHFEPEIDQNIYDTLLREANEEVGFVLDSNSNLLIDTVTDIPIANNSTTTSTVGIVEVGVGFKQKAGFFLPLKEAPSLINHTPARMAAFIACAYYKIVPILQMMNK